MKKLLLSLLLVLPLCGFAQKGMQGVGVSFGYGTETEYYGRSNMHVNEASNLGVVYQRFIANNFRLSASLGIVANRHGFEYDGSEYIGRYPFGGIDMHYFFIHGTRRLEPYAIGGFSIGYFMSSSNDNDDDRWRKREEITWGAKLGAGLNYRLCYHLTAQLEVPIYIQRYCYSFFDVKQPFLMYYYLIPSVNIVYTF